MTRLLTIGDFSRMTHLSVKALRHYHDVGLLEPAEVDRSSGYRLYDASQVPVAQVIRRFRDLGHAGRRGKVGPRRPGRRRPATRSSWPTSSAWRSSWPRPRRPWPRCGPYWKRPGCRRRSSTAQRPAQTALAIRELVTAADMESWWTEAFGTLRKALDEPGVEPGRAGRLPLPERDVRARGRGNGGLRAGHRPGRRLRPGAGRTSCLPSSWRSWCTRAPTSELDQTYGALGTYVAERAIGVEGPIREHYVVSPLDEADPDALRHRGVLAGVPNPTRVIPGAGHG